MSVLFAVKSVLFFVKSVLSASQVCAEERLALKSVLSDCLSSLCCLTASQVCAEERLALKSVLKKG